MNVVLVRRAEAILPLSLSTMVSVAALGLPRTAPEGAESASETVSLPSIFLSSMTGTETVFELSPEAKETVCEAAF